MDAVRSAEWKPTLDDELVQAYIHELGGDLAMEVFQYIQANEPVDSEQVLEHFGADTKRETRKVLYALMEAHALEYATEIDRKGWKTFWWKTDLQEIGIVMKRAWEAQRKELHRLKQWEESHAWLECPKCKLRWTFEESFDLDFQCPNHELPLVESESRVDEYEAALRALDPNAN